MDDLTHSLVGLTLAKAGLERLSPFATATCVVAANAPDIDVIFLLSGDRWIALNHHRAITHSIVGTIVLAVLIPSIFYLVDRMMARLRRRVTRINYRGLLLASLIATATHPLMDLTNNYGVRPLLPWNGRWFYGDLVFIVDPYILLTVGGAAFLLTSDRWPKIIGWGILGGGLTLLLFVGPAQRVTNQQTINAVRLIWIAGLLLMVVMRSFRVAKHRGRSIAFGALAVVVLYWGALFWEHRTAYSDAVNLANQVASARGERLMRTAAMPTPANPFRWLCVAETDQAMYRYFVRPGASTSATNPSNLAAAGIQRYEKPSGRSEQLVSLAARDRRAQILLGFARFPIAHVVDEGCTDQTLVQFRDLRYTEPGAAARGSFALDVPIECPGP